MQTRNLMPRWKKGAHRGYKRGRTRTLETRVSGSALWSRRGSLAQRGGEEAGLQWDALDGKTKNSPIRSWMPCPTYRCKVQIYKTCAENTNLQPEK